MVFVAIVAKQGDRVLLADVLVQDHQDIGPVEDLADNLASLLGIKLFQNIQDLCNDLTDSKDWPHILLRLEVFHVVIEDLTDDFVTNHLTHFIPSHLLGDVDELLVA